MQHVVQYLKAASSSSCGGATSSEPLKATSSVVDASGGVAFVRRIRSARGEGVGGAGSGGAVFVLSHAAAFAEFACLDVFL